MGLVATTVGADGAIENVWTPGLTDNPEIETDLSGDSAVMGGVVTGRWVGVSICGAMFGGII